MTTTETRAGRFVGTPAPRREDRALLTGEGTFTDNLAVPGTVHTARAGFRRRVRHMPAC